MHHENDHQTASLSVDRHGFLFPGLYDASLAWFCDVRRASKGERKNIPKPPSKGFIEATRSAGGVSLVLTAFSLMQHFHKGVHPCAELCCGEVVGIHVIGVDNNGGDAQVFLQGLSDIHLSQADGNA